MIKGFRTALIAVFSLGSAAALGASGAATAFASALVPNESEGVLLPQSVQAAALNEAPSADTFIIIPEASASESAAQEPPVSAPKAQRTSDSLAARVALYNDPQTQNREEECLASAIYFEARSESLDGQLAVAQVILNRAQSGRFPASICGVVMQPSQFSFVRGNSIPSVAKGSRDWQEAVAIARIARTGEWPSLAPKALYFHAARVSPSWRLARVGSIGNHVFYR